MTLLEGIGQPHMSCTHIPEQNAEGVHVNAVIILPCEEFWSHMDGRPHNTATHHSLRLTESQVCDPTTVPLIKLKIYIIV